MLKRVSITGPESTGKSWLAKRLAEHYNTIWVGEFAVDYLNDLDANYILDDITKIAKGQLEREMTLALNANDLLFCDTDILVSKIWSKVVFKNVPEWIEHQLKVHKYDLYLLCSPDIKWENAPFRENPYDREVLFKLYEKELKQLNVNYRIVKGHGEQRLQNAIKFVTEITNEN